MMIFWCLCVCIYVYQCVSVEVNSEIRRLLGKRRIIDCHEEHIFGSLGGNGPRITFNKKNSKANFGNLKKFIENRK